MFVLVTRHGVGVANWVSELTLFAATNNCLIKMSSWTWYYVALARTDVSENVLSPS
jgi:hypothetical protein